MLPTTQMTAHAAAEGASVARGCVSFSFHFEELFVDDGAADDHKTQLLAVKCSASGEWQQQATHLGGLWPLTAPINVPATPSRTQELRPPSVLQCRNRFPPVSFASVACLCTHCRLLAGASCDAAAGPPPPGGGVDFCTHLAAAAAACVDPACDAHALASLLRSAGYDAATVWRQRVDVPAAAVAGQQHAAPPGNASGAQGRLNAAAAAEACHRLNRRPFVVVKSPLAADLGLRNSSQGGLVVLHKTACFIVEANLRSPFEVSKPSAHYSAVLDSLPAVFVGDAPQLARLIAWLAMFLEQHFELRGMPLPPWRTKRALLARWLLCDGLPGCWTTVPLPA